MDPRPSAYRPELDGVRAVAVLLVIGFHLTFLLPSLRPVLRGGFLGVDVFFVLSGMLISGLLVAEHERTGTVRLGAFTQRRALRLLPALTALLLVALVVRAAQGQAREQLEGLWSVVTYVTYGHASTRFPTGLGHVWSLVIEWEFYLLWPLVLVAALRAGASRRALAHGTLALALAVFAVRGVVFAQDGGDWPLSYHSAWLRFDELLLGSAVGIAGALPRIPGAVRTAGLVVLLAVVTQAEYSDGWLYQGGMLLVGLAAALLVAERTEPWSGDRLLQHPVVVRIGVLSYSLYLWSVPTVSVLGRQDGPGWLRAVLAVVVSFVLAEASYRLVESRLRMPSRSRPVPV